MPTVCVCSFMERRASTKRLPADQPTRGADRNHSLAEQADPTTDGMLLPALDPGITLLDVEGGRGVPILQSIVLNHLLLHDGPAFWVDAHGHATTTTLAQIAPSHRLLSRIHVARGFTTYQHYSAVTDLSAAVTRSIQRSTPGPGMDQSESVEPNENTRSHTPSLLVVPAVDARYRDVDTLGETHAATLQAQTLARLSTYADGYDIPVLVTRSERDAFTAPVATRKRGSRLTRMAERQVLKTTQAMKLALMLPGTKPMTPTKTTLQEILTTLKPAGIIVVGSSSTSPVRPLILPTSSATLPTPCLKAS